MTIRLIDNAKTSHATGEAFTSNAKKLVDQHGRSVSYLRLSVTDRCDLRCSYCMPERMKFLPKTDILSFEELSRLVFAFVDRGITKLRITGGEPLVRRDVIQLLRLLHERKASTRLEEITLTTNATRLALFASDLKALGIERINVSLDTLNPDKFRKITRRNVFEDVMAGIDAAQNAGIKKPS